MNYTHYARRPRLALGEPERLSAEDTIITQARDILMSRMGAARGGYLSSPHAARDYLRLTLGTLEREEFWCIWLDAQHRVIAAECLFAGSLTQTSVYPREVVKAALNGVEPEGPQWFPVAYIFHAGQVQGASDLAQPELFAELAA